MSSVVIDEIYKISLFDASLFPNLKIKVLPDLNSTKTCSNSVPLVGGKVSCGVKALGDNVYILITPTNFGLANGINATLEID